ncbi:MAG: hypothetical protein JWO04_6122 [Gammaproteobacteria bacterium]|nr:hypothetical protein [Gammaproteobacteria bacterium]
MSAVRPFNPLLLRTQQLGRLDELQDFKREVHCTIQAPSLLQVIVVMDSVAQCPTMYFPAAPQIHGAPNIDFRVPLAPYLVDARFMRKRFDELFGSHWEGRAVRSGGFGGEYRYTKDCAELRRRCGAICRILTAAVAAIAASFK